MTTEKKKIETDNKEEVIKKSKKAITSELSEFKKFIMKGNIIDMAVGVIVGGAFSKIVTSLVNDILTPIVGIFLGGHDFTNLKVTVGEAEILYGNFIQAAIDFFIIAICIYVVIKIINGLTNKKELEEKKKQQEEEKKKKAAEKKSEEVLLLMEIRDLLQTQTPKKAKSKKEQ